MTNPLPDSLDGTSKMDRNLVVPSKILPVNSKKTVPSLDLPPADFKQSKRFKKDKSKQVTKKTSLILFK